MSVNTAHASNGVLIHAGEYILLHSDSVTMDFSGQDNPVFRGSKSGRIYLTSHRMIFNNKKPGDEMQSFSAPFVALSDVELEQPVFGANYIKGKVRAQPNGNFGGEVKFKLHFKAGGAIEYGQALLRAASTAQSNMHNGHFSDDPPSGAWHEAPPPGYYGWLPSHAAFSGPAPNTVFMSDNPPPYPGIGGRKYPCVHDESFPDDEFLKELEYSINQGRMSQLPNRRKYPAYKTTKFVTTPENPTSTLPITTTIIAETITPPPTNTNTSASSTGTSSSDQQNLSTESVTEETAAEMKNKMAASDPTGLAGPAESVADDDDCKSVGTLQGNRQTKSTSYHDIHNEYTKRRYRHVESKVGQYIASIRAEEEKRRKKFQRHKSMPTSLMVSMTHAEQLQQNHQQHRQQRSLRHSTTDLYKLNESATSDVDADAEVVNSSQHTNVMTNSTHSSSQGAASSSGAGGSSATSRHESSDEAINGADFIDKVAYAQLVEEKEYIEMKLKEKSMENVRLKRNVDYMRIELSNCQDKLKRLNSTSHLSNRSSLMGYSYCGSGSSVDVLGRYAYANPLQYVASTVAKATQTDYPTAMLLRTPIPAALMPDSNNSTGGRNLLRQRTNSNSSAQKPRNHADSQLRPKYPSSTDTGFASHSTELSTTKPKTRKILPSSSSSSSADASLESSPSPSHCKKARSQRRVEEYNSRYDRRSVRYATVAVLNASDDSDVVFNDNDVKVKGCAARTTVSTSNAPKRTTKRSHGGSTSLRHRLMRLLGRCTRCEDPNQTFESYGDAIQMTQSPTPLLNSGGENACRTLR